MNNKKESFINAIARGDIEAAKKLMPKDINFQNEYGETPLSYAATYNRYKSVKWLIDNGANPNMVVDKNGGTILMWAVQHAGIKTIKLLVKHGANVLSKDKSGSTVLDHVGYRNINHTYGCSHRKSTPIDETSIKIKDYIIENIHIGVPRVAPQVNNAK